MRVVDIEYVVLLLMLFWGHFADLYVAPHGCEKDQANV